MEITDKELIKKFSLIDSNLKRLYRRHLKIEKELEHFERYARYSSTIALQSAHLKKEKLRGKEEIMAILANLRGLKQGFDSSS